MEKRAKRSRVGVIFASEAIGAGYVGPMAEDWAVHMGALPSWYGPDTGQRGLCAGVWASRHGLHGLARRDEPCLCRRGWASASSGRKAPERPLARALARELAGVGNNPALSIQRLLKRIERQSKTVKPLIC